VTAYIRHALGAAWRVARFDKDAIAEFDATYGGFYRSFAAMFVCLPLYLLILIAERRIDLLGAARANARVSTSFDYYAIEGISYLAGWLMLPLAMLAISPLIGTNARYVPFVVAYNWGTCVVFAVLAVPYVLYLAGALPANGILFVFYIAQVFGLVYRWRIARDGLQVSAFTASGIVILDVVLGLLLTVVSARLRGA
jgi:hypothetical protein